MRGTGSPSAAIPSRRSRSMPGSASRAPSPALSADVTVNRLPPIGASLGTRSNSPGQAGRSGLGYAGVIPHPDRSRLMRLTDFKILTFDCYGTLIDWESGILAAMRPLLGRLDGKVSDDIALQEFARHESTIQTAEPSLNYRKVLAKTYRALAADWDAKLADGDAERFGNSVPEWPAFADSAESLAYLKQHYKLVILSNVDRASFAESNKRL